MNPRLVSGGGCGAYDTLQDANGEIRLFQLGSGSGEDVVLGEMLHTKLAAVKLDPVLQYEALSYAWGDPKDTDLIACRLRPTASEEYAWLPVTRNLYAALKQLRHASKSRLLWIDALCINQSDVPERNSQVRHMAEIYSYARDVLVWLGKDLGYDPFEGIRSGLEELNRRAFANVFLGFSRDMSGIAQRALPLLARSWFRRKWIIQEVVLAKNVILYCGSFCLPLDQLQRYVRSELDWRVFRPTHTIFRKTPGFQEMLHAATGVSNLTFISRCRSRLTDMRLASILLETRQFECTDPRDFLFSVLSIAEDVKADPGGGLRADYDLPLATVVKMATEWMVTHDGLDILSQATGDDWLARIGRENLISSWTAGGLLQSVNSRREDLINPLTLATSFKEPKWRLWGKQSGPSKDAEARIDADGLLYLSGISADKLTSNLTSSGNLATDGAGAEAVFNISTYRKVESMHIMARLLKWWSLTVAYHKFRYGTTVPLEQTRRRFARLVFLADLVDYSGDRTMKRCAGMEWDAILNQYWEHLTSEANELAQDARDHITRQYSRTNQLDQTVRTQVITREFCITEKGRLALVPPTARDGDVVYIMGDMQSPYLLRPHSAKEFNLIGEAYVEGLTAKQNHDLGTNYSEQIIIR